MRAGAVLIALLTVCAGCEDARPQPPFAEQIVPGENPTTEAGVALGRRLFFDADLSADGSVSCATCHIPAYGFSDTLALSRGVGGREGLRNAPGLANVGYFHRGLFWDGRAEGLEAQALHPIAEPSEMGNSWEKVIEYLKRDPHYPAAFKAAGFVEVSKENVGFALAQFQRALVSSDTKYDRVAAGDARYTPAEALGHAIFFDLADATDGPNAGIPKGECAHCHAPPHFTNLAYENNGLDEALALTDFPDPGRGAVTGTPFDNGRFRVPSLRNVALTAPYMHDGRFASLGEVVDHYNGGGRYAENRSPNLRPIGLTDDQKQALVAFLQTLTDSSFVAAWSQ